MTWNVGFYEHCGLVGKEAGKPETKYFEPTPENIEKLYKGGKRENLTFKGAEPMDWSNISLEDFPQQGDNKVEEQIENKFDQYGRLLNQNYDPLSLGKEPESLEQDTNNFDSSKKPQMKFIPETMVFEYADEAMQKIHDLRQKIQAKEHDSLETKQRELAQGLRDIGFSEKDMGKTGDSRTGQVTEKHRAIAASQIEDAKQIMLQRRLSKRK